MGVYGLGEIVRVAAAAPAEPSRPQVPAQAAVIGLAPLAAPRPDDGLAVPAAGVSAARPVAVSAAADGEDALIEMARAHFVRDRADVVAALRRSNPDLTTAVVDEIADEWVARSLRRYRALLDGRNDGMQELTLSGMLLAIAYEKCRLPQEPVQVLADAHLAKAIQVFSGNGLSPEEARFQLLTAGARLSRSTDHWENELPRK